MLTKSFKAGKCKTALKLAASRIKLLKNKREVQLKQMKRDLAQLLESRQGKTAMIRVEHVLREEKTMAAYDIIQLYCELIVARLPIIESQKSCPIDLKEAIASIIFAAPRCADIMELQDIRKHFTAKYGKEFVNAALELRLDCGVNRTVIEKLSAKTPDGETKIRILTAIAEEHNVKWDRESLEEQVLKPPEDLLNGPRKFVSASTMHTESPSQLQPPASQMHKPSSTSVENDVISSSVSSAHVSSTNMSTASIPTIHPELRTSERTAVAGKQRHPFYNNETASSNKQGWAMEFKDATSAAQAAAESAEMASMAARAAAELSRGNFTKEYATGSHGASFYGPREYGETASHVKAEHDENSARTEYDPRGGSHGRSSPWAMNKQSSEREDDHLSRAAESRYHSQGSVESRGTRSTSLRSNMASFHEEELTGNPKADEFLQDRSTEVDEKWQSKNFVKEDFHREVGVTKQPSHSASSNSSMDSIDNDISFFSHQEGSSHDGFSELKSANENQWRNEMKKHDVLGVGSFQHQPGQFAFSTSNMDPVGGSAVWVNNVHDFDDDVDHSSSSMAHGKAQMNSEQPDQSNYPTAVFDDSGSDGDSHLELESHTDRHEFHSYFSPEGRQLPSNILPNTDPWSPMQKPSQYQQRESTGIGPNFVTGPHASPLFSEGIGGTTVLTQSSYLLPVTFDDSDDDPASESEEEDFKIRDRMPQSSSKPDNLSVDKKNATTGSERKPVSHSRYDLELEESHSEINQKADLNTAFQHYSSPGRERKFPQKSNDLESEPYYTSNVKEKHHTESLISPLSKGVQEEFCTPVMTSGDKDVDFSNLSNESGGELNLGRLTGGLRNRNYTLPPYTKGCAGNDRHPSAQPTMDEVPAIAETTIDAHSEKASANSEAVHPEMHSQKQSVNIRKESKAPRRTFFDSDSDDAEEIQPHRPVESSGYRGSPKLSRRTRDPPKRSAMGGPSRLTNRSEVSTSSDGGGGSRPSAQSSSEEPLSRRQSHTSRPSSLAEQPSRELPQTETSVQRKSVKSSRPTLAFEQPSQYGSNNGKSGSNGGSKLPSLTVGSGSKGNSQKIAGHVHPKLPDYDSLAAHFESLRSDRHSG